MQTILKSEITCPNCGHKKIEEMPTNACQFFYECDNCQKVLKPKEGDCCVYCSYGTVPWKTMALPESAIVKEGDRFFVFSAEKENEDWSFIPIEVLLGAKDGNWIAVQFTEVQDKTTKFAYNNAYYLIAEMKKGETEHEH